MSENNIIYGGANHIVVKSVDKAAETIGAAIWTGNNLVGTTVTNRDDLGIDITLDQEDSSDGFRTLINDYRSEKASETSTSRLYEDSTKVGGTVQTDVPLVWVESYGGVLGDETKRGLTTGFFYIDPTSGGFSQGANAPNAPALTMKSVPAPFAATADSGAGDTTLEQTLVGAAATVTIDADSKGKTINVVLP